MLWGLLLVTCWLAALLARLSNKVDTLESEINKLKRQE